ncbi:MAG: DNA-processing protein DprA [Gammaproteobacteria bacterium]|nr:DNA-processing protein DprA [Gammaproteobacteria bacterium]
MQKDWIQLAQLKGLTLPAKRELVRALGSPRAVLSADRDTLAGILRAAAGESATGKGAGKTPKASTKSAARKIKIPRLTRPNVDADVAVLERIGARYIGFTDADFPPLLNQISAPPLGVFALGARELLLSPQLAVVGSRSPTPAGRRTTAQFAAALCAAGLTITSGMARGIDGSAHRGCLDAGGRTVGVLATGIDVAYPRANADLYREIAERGLIVSEYPPGSPPRREFFPQRNRIISGLALGTLVVEAGIRSGSLITAKLAAEQGREVFAVPGSIHVAVSRGCHHLLRQGAKLVESADDVIEEIGQFFSAAPVDSAMAAPGAEARLLAQSRAVRRPPAEHDGLPPLYDLIDYAPVSMDQLIEQSGLTADQVSHILMELELNGLIAAAAGGYQRLPQ